MKAIFIAPGLGRVKRGYERFVLELAAELRRAGIDAECWGTSEASGVEAISVPGREELQRIAFERLHADERFTSLPPTALQDWGLYAEDQLFAIPAAAQIAELLKQDEPLAVYAKWQGGLVDPSGAPTQLLKLLASANLERKAFLVVHTDYVHPPIDSLLWKAGGTFHALGPWISERLAQLGVEHAGILEFPMCIDASAYNACRQHRTPMRRELGIPPDAFVILSVGSFDTTTPDKRHAHLLREIQSVSADDKVWWAVAGSRGPMPTAWEQEARQALGSRFIPLPNLEFERMPHIYGMADLFALASMDETFGLAYLEAQIAGLPVVIHESATSRHLCGGLPPEFRKLSLVDMRRDGTASTAIDRWLYLLTDRASSESVRVALGEFAREQERRFGWKSVGPQYAAAFQNLVKVSRQCQPARRDFGTWDEQTHRQGIGLFEQGKVREALLLFGRALGGRETSERWNDWATAQMVLKQSAEADQGFRRALALDPRNAQAAANLGALLATTNRCTEAIPLLAQASSGVDSAQQAVISELLADCRTRQSAGAPPVDQEITNHLRTRIGPDFDDAIRFQEQLPYYLAVVKAIPPSLPGKRMLGIGPDPQLLASAFARWKGYDQICWHAESGDRSRDEPQINVVDRAPIALGLDPFEVEGTWPYLDSSFDVVFIGRALERLSRDPMGALSEANRVLKPGGQLFLTAANLASGQAVHAVLHAKSPYVHGRFAANSASSVARHSREYTPGEIVRLANAAGFSAVQLETRDVYWQAPDKIFPALAASGYPVGMRGDTILLSARKETPVRDRYPAKIYDLAPERPATRDARAAPALASATGAQPPSTRSETRRPLRVLAVHENLPRPDQSGAEYRFLQTLRELRAQGHSVAFLAARGFEEERYTPALTELGIEVYSNDAEVLRREGIETVPQWTFQEILRDGQFDVAVLFLWFWMSVSIPEHYLDAIRRLSPRTRIIVLTDDCHGLRELRGANLTGTWSDRERAQDYREREAEILRGADLALAISEDDRKRLLEDSPQLEIGLLPMVVQAGPTRPDFDAREGLMYLADYNNPASCDGIDWYLKHVAPIVRASLSGAPVYLVGAGLRPDFAAGYHDVVHVGFVPELSTELAKRRMLLAPVRYGTGTKTKILHALAHGIPVVTTTIGAEGMELIREKSALIADSSQDFARAVVRLYADRDLWQTLAVGGRVHVLKKYPHRAMASLLRQALDRARDLQPKPYDPAHAWSIRLVDQYFPELLTHFPPQERTALRVLAYARAAEQLAAAGNSAEARRQIRHVFSYVPHRIPRETLFGELFSIAEIMERTYRALGEAEGAAEFSREARRYAPGAFPEGTVAPAPPATRAAAALGSANGAHEYAKTTFTAPGRSGRKVDFSVVIPTYNRCETLRACLQALSSQSFSSRRFEVIVVDDGSNDGTEEFCRKFRPRFEFHHARQANAGAGAARRLGVEQANGKFLLFFNDDTVADRALLAQHWRAHHDSLGGKMAVLGDFRYPESARRRALTHFLCTEPFLFPQVTLAPGDHSKNAYFIASNLSIRRDAVLGAGSFDPRFRIAEDTELGLRLRQMGFHVRYVPEARAIHDHAAFTLGDLVRRAELYGRTQLLLLRKHPDLLGDGSGPFGRLDAAAIGKLRAYAEEREIEVKEASQAIEKFDSIDFEPFFLRSSSQHSAAAEDVMDAFKLAVPAIFWFHIVRGFLAAWDEEPDEPPAAGKLATDSELEVRAR
ncbi:MAG: glycosyltransferase [Candidatus Acidiferrales bacterium]